MLVEEGQSECASGARSQAREAFGVTVVEEGRASGGGLKKHEAGRVVVPTGYMACCLWHSQVPLTTGSRMAFGKGK